MATDPKKGKFSGFTPPPAPSTKKEDWTALVLKGLVAPVTEENVKFLRGWQAKEGTSAANNPLATTQSAAGATQFNSVGVKNYPDAATGIEATIRTLQNGRYNGIIAAFKTGNAIAASQTDPRVVAEFGTWAQGFRNNSKDPAAWDANARGYRDSVIKLSGEPPRALPSTPGAGETFADAVASATDDQIRRSQTDPYVTKSGKFVYGAPPADGLASKTGDIMRRSEFIDVAKELNNIYYAYLGRNASEAEIAGWADGSTSVYELKKKLSEKPEFYTSPVYQEKAGDYITAAKNIYGEKYKPPKELLGRAIASGMNQGAFENELRQLSGYQSSEEFKKQAGQYAGVARQIFGPRYTPPKKLIADAVVAGVSAEEFATQLRGSDSYEQSNEFKQNYSGLYGSYATVYGRPDENGKNVVKAAAKQGWTRDQFEQYLRSQDAYTQSPEYQAKSLAFLDAMGLVTGGTAVLRDGSTPKNPDTPQPGPGDPGVGPPAMGLPAKKGKTPRAVFAGQKGGAEFYG